MRLYSFTNSGFIKEIQNGLQTAHVVAELFLSYTEGKEHEVLVDWAKNHKTIIILRGGNHQELQILFDDLAYISETLELPLEIFQEDETQNHLTTAVSIVVPEEIYDREYEDSPFRDPNSPVELMTPEWQLFEIIKGKSLA